MRTVPLRSPLPALAPSPATPPPLQIPRGREATPSRPPFGAPTAQRMPSRSFISAKIPVLLEGGRERGLGSLFCAALLLAAVAAAGSLLLLRSHLRGSWLGIPRGCRLCWVCVFPRVSPSWTLAFWHLAFAGWVMLTIKLLIYLLPATWEMIRGLVALGSPSDHVWGWLGSSCSTQWSPVEYVPQREIPLSLLEREK